MSRLICSRQLKPSAVYLRAHGVQQPVGRAGVEYRGVVAVCLDEQVTVRGAGW